jgi:hypothetical protein
MMRYEFGDFAGQKYLPESRVSFTNPLTVGKLTNLLVIFPKADYTGACR